MDADTTLWTQLEVLGITFCSKAKVTDRQIE